MGWANCGTDSKGRPIGYGHSGRCDHPGCEAEIDRGLGYACGPMHGEHGNYCEGYFCQDHRTYRYDPDEERGIQFCLKCAERLDESKFEEFKEVLIDFVKPAQEPRFRIEGETEFKVYDTQTGLLVGHIIFRYEDQRWFYRQSVDPNVPDPHISDITLGFSVESAKARFNSLTSRRAHPTTVEEHRKAIYDLLMRWDEVEDLAINPFYMSEEQMAHVRRTQQSRADFKASIQRRQADAASED